MAPTVSLPLSPILVAQLAPASGRFRTPNQPAPRPHPPPPSQELTHSPNAAQKSLKEAAQSNPSLLGDATSLKAETSDTQPRQENSSERPATTREIPASSENQMKGSTQSEGKKDGNKDGGKGGGEKKKTLKELAMQNPTMLGDPVSLKAETADSEPTPNDRGAASSVPAGEAPQQQQEKPVKAKI